MKTALGSTSRPSSTSGPGDGVLERDAMVCRDMFGSSRKLSPEERLMLAVLEEAIDALEYPKANDPKGVAHEAWEWLHSDREIGLYDFVNICSVFNLDPGSVRQSLRERLHDPTGGPRFERRMAGSRATIVGR